MKKLVKWCIAGWLCIGLVLLLFSWKEIGSFTVHATGTDNAASQATATPTPTATPVPGTPESLAEDLGKAQRRKNALEQKKEETKEIISDLKKEKKNLILYIETLDAEVEKLTGDIEDTKTDIAKTEAELADLQKELKVREKEVKSQYEIMKQRIKYMYENGSDDYLAIILHSQSISEMLSRAEYISQISEYDKGLLDRYTDAKEEVETKKAEVEETLTELTVMEEALTADKETVETLIADKSKEIERYNEKIANSKSALTEYEEEVRKQEELVDQLLDEQRKKIQEEMDKKKDNGNGSAADNPVYDDGSATGFRWPLMVAGTITSPFGYRSSPTAGASTYHKGIDIGVASGSLILASKAGEVVTATYQSAAGNYIAIYHGDGIYTYYMHCSKLAAKVGDKVEQGQVIAYVGSTGVSTGPHLHFAIVVNDQYVDPMNYVSP